VTDGIFSVWIEETWDDGSSKTSVTSVSFTKSSTEEHLTPANTTNFTNMTLNWVPSSSTSIIPNKQLIDNISIYPNPSTGLVNINFNDLTNISVIKVQNSNGTIVLENK